MKYLIQKAYRSIKTPIKNFINFILIPFAIVRVRLIQYRYKHLTINNTGNRTNQILAELKLLQAKEHYYKTQFSAWGKYHPSFSFSSNEYLKHLKFINWLFPEKNFEEVDIVIWYHPEAVTYYHNKIFKLQDNVASNYANEIKKQIKEWNNQALKNAQN